MALESQRLQPAHRYALLVIDASRGFTEPELSPLGANMDAAMGAIRQLLDVFRTRQQPVFYTTVIYHDEEQLAVFRKKLPALNLLQPQSRMVEIDPRLDARPEEIVVKQGASGFFGTDLLQRLQKAGVDGVVITGFSTSGCVRATVVDALQHNFRVVVPAAAVGDRDMSAHQANLQDIDIKYGDVLDMQETLALLEH